MKKYNVNVKKSTGSWFFDGSLEYANDGVKIRTDSIKYLIKKIWANFSEMDIHTKHVHVFDLNTGESISLTDLVEQYTIEKYNLN